MPRTAAPVTLQVSLAPTDFRHAREILPHELRQLGSQVAEILLVLDLNRGPWVEPDAWSRDEAALRELIDSLAGRYPQLRTLDVDHSDEVTRQVAEEYFGGIPVPDKNWRGAPIYPYFFGLWAARQNYVFHTDSDMLYGGGSKTWIAEAVALLQRRPDVLLCSPLPGPPTHDGTLTSQQLEPEPLDSLAYRANHVSTRVFMIDKRRFRVRVGALELTPPSRSKRWLARLDGHAPYERAEMLLSLGMDQSGLCRVDFLGADPGMWSLHPPYRSEAFYTSLPELVRRVESGDVPPEQRGQHDVHDSLVDWTSVRKPRWRRLAHHGRLAVRNLF